MGMNRRPYELSPKEVNKNVIPQVILKSFTFAGNQRTLYAVENRRASL
jgi:hypothetical protein